MPVDNFREIYGYATTPDEAKAAVKSAAKRIERAKKEVEITMPGTTQIIAGMVVTLTGFRPGVGGRYKIITVRHSLSRAGFTTSLTGEAA